VIAVARRIFRSKNAPRSFDDEIPEEIIAERLTELWERKDALEQALTDPETSEHASAYMRELAEVEEALGLRKDGDPIRTGDELSDYLIARTTAGTITPEDLELTPETFRRLKREGRIHG